MQIGVIREIKDQERRVALTPDGARRLVASGHRVIVETGAGNGAGFSDSDYTQGGAECVSTEQAWASDLVVKVKEPQPAEYDYFDGQILFAFLHLAGVPALLGKALIKSKVTAIACEMVTDDAGRYPLLAPMSAIAGNMAINVGNYYLAHTAGGKGVQIGQVLERHNGRVVVIGDGIVGQHAARTASGLGASVTLIGRGAGKTAALCRQYPERLSFVEFDAAGIGEHVRDADLVIGAVLVPGDRTPVVVTEAMVAGMTAGSVIVDVSIDQGGCIETARVTSHSDPIYCRHGVIHYAVSNMPGAYPRTGTLALTDASLPCIRSLADGGVDALHADAPLAAGVNTHRGFITSETVARALRLEPLYQPFSTLEQPDRSS